MRIEPDVALQTAVRDYMRPAAGSGSGISANGGPGVAYLTMDGLAEARSDIVSPEITQSLRESNAQTSLAILPSELLADVFGHLGVYDRLSASEVCHHWRLSATQFARAWTDLRGFGLLSPRVVLAMDRSRTLPIRLEFTVEGPDSSSSLASRNSAEASLQSLLVRVSHHVHHVQTLAIKLRFAGATMPMILDALAVPAPLIKQLTLDYRTTSRDGSADVTLRGDLFAGSAPLLARVTLRHVLLPAPPVPALEAVTFLHLKTRTERGRVYQTAHLVLHKLLEYELDVPRAHDPDPVQPAIPPAQTLRVVRVLARCKTPGVTLRPYVLCPRISMVQLSCKLINGVWRDAAARPSRLVILSLNDRTFVGGTNDAGICRLFGDVSDSAHNASLVSYAASHLRALVTNAVRWPDADRSVRALPQLAYLHIVVRPVDGTRWTPRRMPTWMRAPRLQTLRISVLDGETATDVAQASLEAQITEFLPTLEACGLVFLELDGVALARVPDGFVVRPPSLRSLDHFLPGRIDQFANWDDWLAHMLLQLRDL